MQNPSQQLQDTVIAHKCCIGCGACTAIPGSPFHMVLNKYGLLEATVESHRESEGSQVDVLSVCPFSDTSKNENDLADIFFPNNPVRSDYLGAYIGCYVGYTKERALRKKASSGGIGRWMARQLLQSGALDYVLHVAAGEARHSGQALYSYVIDSDPDAITASAKSAYYPVTLDAALRRIREQPGRYLVTGVPCFIKAIRLLMNKEKVFADRIRYTVGLVCGGMKSRAYAETIAWEQGIHPDQLVGIDFREKYDNKPAHFKGNAVRGSHGQRKVASSKELYVTDYGMGFFMPTACDYCDDVVGELADISIGDAWLPRYVLDSRGTSLIITRNAELDGLLREGARKGMVGLKPLAEKRAIRSQQGGFRHRREGLAYRLYKKRMLHTWTPPKRVRAENILDAKRRNIYDVRERIASVSHDEFLRARRMNSFDQFIRSIDPLVTTYKRLYRRGRLIRILSKISMWMVAIGSAVSRSSEDAS